MVLCMSLLLWGDTTVICRYSSDLILLWHLCHLCVQRNPRNLVDCDTLRSLVPKLVCTHLLEVTVSQKVTELESPCRHSAFTYAFNSFMTHFEVWAVCIIGELEQTVDTRYIPYHTACSDMNTLTLPFISLLFTHLFFLSLLLSCPLLLTFSLSLPWENGSERVGGPLYV